LACAIPYCGGGWSNVGPGLEPTAAARRPTTQATLPSADHAAEIARLQRENERLRMERDILKKSIAIFAGVPK
jgi:transposase